MCMPSSGHRDRSRDEILAAYGLLSICSSVMAASRSSAASTADSSGLSRQGDQSRVATASAAFVSPRDLVCASPRPITNAEAISAADTEAFPAAKGDEKMEQPMLLNPAAPIERIQVDPSRPFAPLVPPSGLAAFRPETTMRQLKIHAPYLSIPGLLYPEATFCVTLWPPSDHTTVRMSGETLAKFAALLPKAAMGDKYIVDLRIRDWPSGGVAIIPDNPEAVRVAKEVEGGFDKIADGEQWYFRQYMINWGDGTPSESCIKILRAYEGVDGPQSDEVIEKWFDDHSGLVDDDPHGRRVAERMEYDEDVLYDRNAQPKRKRVPVIVPIPGETESSEEESDAEGETHNEGGDDGHDHDGNGNSNGHGNHDNSGWDAEAFMDQFAGDAEEFNMTDVDVPAPHSALSETNGHSHPTGSTNIDASLNAPSQTATTIQETPKTPKAKKPRVKKQKIDTATATTSTGKRPYKRRKKQANSDDEDDAEYVNTYAARRAGSRSSVVGGDASGLGPAPRAARTRARKALKAEAEAEAEVEAEVEAKPVTQDDVKQEPHFEAIEEFTF